MGAGEVPQGDLDPAERRDGRALAEAHLPDALDLEWVLALEPSADGLDGLDGPGGLECEGFAEACEALVGVDLDEHHREAGPVSALDGYSSDVGDLHGRGDLWAGDIVCNILYCRMAGVNTGYCWRSRA